VGEIRALTWEDVDRRAGTITMTARLATRSARSLASARATSSAASTAQPMTVGQTTTAIRCIYERARVPERRAEWHH
jgi:hypothetical protein